MSDSRLIEIACVVRVETRHAYLIDDGSREVWAPKSVEMHDEGKSAVVVMPEWLAKEKELI